MHVEKIVNMESDSEVVRSRKRHDHNMDAEMGTLEEETGEIT